MKMCRREFFQVCCLMCAMLGVLLVSPTADAQTWNSGSGTSGNWSDPSKWVGGVPPTAGNSTLLDFSGTISSDLTATNDLGAAFHLFALRFNIENSSRTATLNGDSLYFEGPAMFNGQSVIEQNGSGFARIQNNMSIGGVGMTVQGVGAGSVWMTGAVEGSGIAKINSSSSTLRLQGGTSGAGLGYLVSRSGLTQITGNQNYQFGYLGVNDSGSIHSGMEILSQAKVNNSGQLVIGNNASSSGSLSVQGAGSVFDQIGNAFIGNSGVGGFFAANGGIANFSQTVQVGVLASAAGTLDAYNGQLNFADSVHLGVAQNSSGVMNLLDSATLQAATNSGATFTVGFAGQGNLNILDGSSATIGSLSNTSPFENELVVGRETTGVGRVQVTGASLTATNAVFGNSGDGRLLSTSNSTLDFGDTVYLGYHSGSNGEAVISDFSDMTAREIQIGRAGVGSFTVSNGAQVAVTESTFVAPLGGSTGDLRITNFVSSYQTGNLNVGGLISGGLPVTGGEGRVEVVSNGSLIVNSDLVLFDQGSILVDSSGLVSVGAVGGVNGAINVNTGGRLIGTGQIDGHLIVNDFGVLTPGINGIGQLQIDGDLTFAATANAAVYGWDLADAGLATDVLGASSSTAVHDQLIINGGSVMMNNVSIVLSELDSFAASFDASQSYSWKLMEISGAGNFTTVGPFSIVFNGSSEIQSAINANFGTLSLAVGNNGGSDPFLALTYSAVPEPNALILVAVGLLCGVVRRRRPTTATSSPRFCH